MKIKDTDDAAHSLTTKQLAQADPQNEDHQYYVLLKDLKGITNRGKVRVNCRACLKHDPDQIGMDFSVTITDKSIRIGCTRFVGENAKKLLSAIKSV